MNDVAISLKNVSKYYKLYNAPKDRLKEALSPAEKKYHKRYYATKNLDLEIKKGEILGIVGKNGSGKSTLLKLITKVLTPDEGSIKVNGEISALLELGSGFNPEFTGIQNIFFYGTILGISKQKMKEKLNDIVQFADIGDFIDQPIKTYSSGMKARLGFAVAVHIDPEILILDEVLSVGDVLFRRKCYAKMEEFFKGGKTIIYVSHDTNSINELCTRAIFLHQGNIILDSDPNTVSKYYEKYLFANKENQEKIKNEILNLSIISDPETMQEKINVEKNESEYNKNFLKNSPEKQNAFLIPNMKPQSTVEYNDYDVGIDNIHIETQDGETVNVLVQDEVYNYCYTVSFGLAAKNASFSTQIKSEKGVRISGAALHNADIGVDVKKGDQYKVTYTFTCQLLQGTYYTNTAVSALVDFERIYLNRMVDAFVFKVIKKEKSIYAGLVHLNQHIEYKKVKSL